MAQEEPARISWPAQLSVSVKLPVMVTPPVSMEKPNPPVFVTVMVCGLLEDPTDCAVKVRDEGESDAVVSWAPAVKSGICQRPRPYVAATSTGVEEAAGVAPRATAGVPGSPAPMGSQQVEGAVAQAPIWRVAKTPKSVATYTVLGSLGSMRGPFTGTASRLDMRPYQCAPPSVER